MTGPSADPRNIQRFVIFLGPTTSARNTICWKLTVGGKSTDGMPKPSGVLSIPDSALIQAVEPWPLGFFEMYWRHRYERLVRAVLKDQSLASTERIRYSIPFGNPGQHFKDMMNRILGSHWYFYKTEFHRDIQTSLRPIIRNLYENPDDQSLPGEYQCRALYQMYDRVFYRYVVDGSWLVSKQCTHQFSVRMEGSIT